MLNALVDNKLCSNDAFQYGNVGISSHRFHSEANSCETRDLHYVGRIRKLLSGRAGCVSGFVAGDLPGHIFNERCGFSYHCVAESPSALG
jgi:hypothetical protein